MLMAHRERNDAIRVIMGMSAGLIAAFFATPFDFIRTVQQAHVGAERSALGVVREVTHTEGIRAMWSGCSALLARAAVFTAAQLVSYDEAKLWVSKSTGYDTEAVPTHMMASLISGLFTTVATSPLEMVKTHMQMSTKKGGKVTFISSASTVLRTEGIFAFWRGFTPLYLKIAPHTFIVLVLTEQFRAFFSVKQVL